jgi:hypothetical protein
MLLAKPSVLLSFPSSRISCQIVVDDCDDCVGGPNGEEFERMNVAPCGRSTPRVWSVASAARDSDLAA